MHRKLVIISLLLSTFSLYGQLYIQDEADVYIWDDATLEVAGNLVNNGRLFNNGTLTLFGDWSDNYYSGLLGTIQFVGPSSQLVNATNLSTGELIVNNGGELFFSGNQFLVTDRIEFTFGTVRTDAGTRFVLGPNANVAGGSNASYFDGQLIAQGSGIKTFPLGNNGIHSPLTLLNVSGSNTEIGASFTNGNTVDPIPGDSILGVSHRGLWEVELLRGEMDPTLVELGYKEEDLTSFNIINNIRHRSNGPVIAYALDAEGIYESLGLGELRDSDTLTFGTITSDLTINPVLNQKLYLAMALAPKIPSEGLYYIPEAFSPRATDPRNQRFRVFGEGITEEGFSLVIYNRLGSKVFSTESFAEANVDGWNGNNLRTGAEEPTGMYYYTVRLQFQTGLVVEKQGFFYLIR